METKVVLKSLGTCLKYAGFVFLVPIIVAIIYGEYHSIQYFFIGFLISFILGLTLERAFYTEQGTKFKEGMATVAMIWLVVTLISTIPFVFVENVPFVDALFESMSAWTTTGFSLLDLERTSKSILFWRSLEQWVGGIGIVILALSGLFKTANTLYIIEGHERIKPNVINALKTIWWIYIFYTIVGIFLLFLVGMPLFDSVNYAMTGIATGGMGVHPESIGLYDSFGIEVVMMLIMVLGAVSFFMHYQLIAGDRKKALKDTQTLTLIVLIIVATLLLLPFHSLRAGVFHAVSGITCSGFQVQNLTGWGDYSKSVLIVLMIFGGAAGSTVGALKLNRVLIFFNTISDNIKKLLKPRLIPPMRIGNISYTDEEVQAIFKFIGIYIIFLVFSSFVLMFHGNSAVDSLFQAASAQGNVGLSVIPELSIISKTVLIFNMWIGRLEIWSVLIFIIYVIRGR